MKSAFITGANRGLGFGFVQYLAGQGYQVFAGARNINTFDPDIKNVTPIQIDISSDTSIQSAFSEISNNTNSLNLLINNAGLNKDSATNNHKEKVCELDKLDRESLQKMFDINSISPLLVTKTFLKLLIHNPSYIINVSSDRASFHSEIPNTSANYGYRASKVALNMMVAASTLDLPKHIKTFAIHPGSVLTDMNPHGTQTPLEQAEKIVGITSNWKDEWNGQFLRENGEYYPL